MALDTLSFIAPARPRALLCPLGRIRRSRFSSFVSRLQAANVVRLSDVTPATQPNRSMFNPQGFPDGQIIWDLTTSVDREHEYLETFELHRRTFVVIAVADYAEAGDPEVLSQQLDDLKLLYPRALYHVCLIFDAPPQAVDHEKFKSPGHPRFLAVPTQQESRVTSIRTLMCDITTPILSEMSAFAKTLQALPTLDSPLSQENKPLGNLRDRRNSVPPGGGLHPGSAESAANKRKTMAGFGNSAASGGGYPSERVRLKGKGRVQIAIAQLHLLAGRVPVALKEFVDGADACRSSNDHLWHGKALEGIGICLVFLANSKAHFQIPTIPYAILESVKQSKNSPASSKPPTPNPTPANGLEPSTPQQVLDMLPELHGGIINLYQRAANFPGESVPHISYCETVLRYTKLLTSMHLANGISADTLSHIVTGALTPRKGPKKNKPSRIEISENAMRAYPHPIEMMTVLEATKVLSGIASILGAVGLRRRKAMVTRELLKILVPSLIQARVVGAAEVGIHPAAGLSALSGGHGSPLDLGEGDVESGIMELLEDLCRSYGVLSSLGEENTPRENEPPQRPASSGSTLALKTSVWTKAVIAENEIRSFGWPSLKIHVLRNCTALCEALPDFQGVLNFTTQLLKTADIELTQDEQIKLSTTITRTVGAARKLGLAGVAADYWDQFLLRDIEYVENSTWRPPTSRNRNELVDTDSLMSTATIEEITPFIYNPFKVLESSTEEQILVKSEPAEFKVTLQNPFEFEVEVESVTLDATGVDLEVQQAGVIIAPFRTFQVSIFATPNNTGEVHISGCRIKVYGCKERSFPIFTGGLDPRERDPKTKRFGLKAAEPRSERPISTISATGRSSLRLPPVLHPIPKTLSLTVVDSQPLLVVKNTSLSQSALMVLEGERKVFQITLKNLSDVEVDFLAFYFSDSTTGRIQQALAEKTNTPAEIYELELMLAKKRAFVYHRSSPRGQSIKGSSNTAETPILDSKSSRQDLKKRKIYIPANGTASFEIEVLGKPGLTQGTIQANYSHLGCSRSEIGDRFYTREVVYPVTVTVNASIELARVDFIPFSTDLILAPRDSPSYDASLRPFKELFSGMGIYEDPSEYCLMLLDMRNAWPQPLEIKMSIKDSVDSSEDKAFESQDVLQAGHTSRIILPVKRIFLTNPYAPIPSISASQRQFVVSSTKISLEQERQSREAFWYREELLKRLQGVWEELGTTRKGSIELRGIRLTPRMVETIRVDEIGVSVGVESDSGGTNSEDGGVKSISPWKFIVATDRFHTLTTTVVNRTTRKIRPVLRLLPSLKNLPVPAAFDLNRRFAINGLLQQALPPLEPGETKKIETGFVVWAKGEYDISASVEEAVVGETVVEVAEGLDKDGMPMDVLGGAATRGRRCWVCREVCLIIARDLE